MDVKLELKDWKDTERVCIEQIRAAHMSLEVNMIILARAQKEIKAFGGLTAEEENKNA